MPSATNFARHRCRRIALTVIVADPLQVELPPYLASLIVTCGSVTAAVDTDRAAMIAKTFATLRPYGGMACLPVPAESSDAYSKVIAELKLPGAKVFDVRRLAVAHARRAAARHGSAGLTSMPTPPTRGSRRTPWSKRRWACCGSAARRTTAILPRHGHGPQPQVVDGRLFIEGRRSAAGDGHLHRPRAVGNDAARHRRAVRQHGPSARRERQRHQLHRHPRRHLCRLQVVLACKLDPATGKKLAEFKLPGDAGTKPPPAGAISTSWTIISSAAPTHSSIRSSATAT